MQNAILNVVTKKDFVFRPNKLLIRVIDANIVARTAKVYYELTEDGISTEGRESREWVDRGNIEVPLDAIAGAFNNQGQPNAAIINMILQNFNLELAKYGATINNRRTATVLDCT